MTRRRRPDYDPWDWIQFWATLIFVILLVAVVAVWLVSLTE